MKVIVELTHDQLKQAVIALWKEEQCAFPPDTDLYVSIYDAPPTPPPPVVVVNPGDGKIGHMVTANPPMSATGIDTEFGYRDPEDNGIGFFINPATGKSYLTDNVTLIGISLPREVLLSTFGISDDWRNHSITEVWKQHGASVRNFALKYSITSNVDGGGLSLRSIPLVDAGPAAGLESKALIDLTYGAALALKTNGKAVCTFELLKDGVPMELKGIIFDKGIVG